MPRKKDQEARRRQIVDAARSVVAEKGVATVQLRDVAAAAQLTPGAILYYYEDLSDLLRDVYEHASHRFSIEREHALAAISSPVERLGRSLTMSVPRGRDDSDVRLLFEFDALIVSDPRYVDYARLYQERQVAMYVQILETGAAEGVFTLTSATEDIARNLLALEDAHGFSVLIGAITPARMERLLHDVAAAFTGVAPATLAEERQAASGV
jgi:AcrR family transcriptional regulator